MLKRLAVMLCLLASLPLAASAQAPGNISYAKATAVARPGGVKPGGRTTVVVTIDVTPGFHINSVKPADPNLIPTHFTMSASPGFSFGKTLYPPNKTVKESYSPKPMLVYMGKVTIRVPVTVARTVRPGHYKLSDQLSYQGCNATACYPPHVEALPVTITVNSAAIGK